MSDTVIVSAARTPLASFQGGLSPLAGHQLGSVTIAEALKRAGVDGAAVGEVIMGCVLPAGQGQNPARQASIGAGIPDSIGAFTINKVCSSGLLSLMLADRALKAGAYDIAVCGGMESMTNAPYLLPKARAGLRLGDAALVDGMIFDGLWDIFSNRHMGILAEMCAEKYGFTREMQDDFAEGSYRKALAAIDDGAFADEIVPVPVPQRKGEPMAFDVDEEPGRVNFERMRTLKPSFQKEGTVTAANASSISDGAAAFVVMTAERAKKEGCTPLARVISHATFSHDPQWFTTAPIGAIKLVLERAGLALKDIDLFEVNEAFSAVTMAAIQELHLDAERVNIHGGAVALGHPIGASGARILTTLLYALKNRGLKRGLATLCNGGGEATAVIVEMI